MLRSTITTLFKNVWDIIRRIKQALWRYWSKILLPIEQPVEQQIANVKLTVELEVAYDSFKGRSLKEFADLVECDLHESLSDFREEDVLGIFSKLESVNLINE